jgi:hypothetical protein
MSSSSFSFFEIVRQESLGREQYANNSCNKIIHVVAKNLPFVIEVKSSFNLNAVRFYACLCYDHDDYGVDFKQVDFVKQAPLTFKAFVHSTGDSASVEIRLQVLSSHMEDSLFRVKIGFVDSASNTNMEVISEAMRVVSKPALVNKPKKIGASPRTKRPATPNAPPTTTLVSQNSDVNSIMEVLVRMEQQQKAHQRFLEKAFSSSSRSSNDGRNICSFVIPERIPDPQDQDFEKAFHHLLELYRQLPQQDRHCKLRKVVSEYKDASVCHDLLDGWLSSCFSVGGSDSQESSVVNSPVSSPSSVLSSESSLFFPSQEEPSTLDESSDILG